MVSTLDIEQQFAAMGSIEYVNRLLSDVSKRQTHPRPALQTEYEPPQGEVEEALAQIWSEVLGVEPVGRHDDFFELGGHSLLALQIIAHAQRAFTDRLSLRSLFENPTLLKQAGLIESLPKVKSVRALSFSRVTNPRPPLSYAQQRLWFLWKLDPQSSSMNSAVVLRLAGQIDLDDFRFVWEFLLARHSSLRTVFREEDGLLWQQVQDGSDLLSLTVTRLSSSEGNQESRLKECLTEEIRRPFDLERGPLLRIHLFSLNEKSHDKGSRFFFRKTFKKNKKTRNHSLVYK